MVFEVIMVKDIVNYDRIWGKKLVYGCIILGKYVSGFTLYF